MDKYSLNARIYPMIIIFLPIVIIGLAYSVEYQTLQQSLSAFGGTAALTYLLSNLGRDQGKKKERLLWESWGGAPTSQLFCYKNLMIDKLTKDRYHSRMEELSNLDERIDYINASTETLNEVYKSWTKLLIAKTRDTNKFPLIFIELISYGFRRNIWGLKPIGVVLTCLGIAGNYVYQSLNYGWSEFTNYSLAFYVSEAALVMLLLTWFFVVNKEWVRIPAFGYAERLLEAIDKLDN
jgi:hypothetical protein